MNIIKLISLLMAIPLITGHFQYRRSVQHKWPQKFKFCDGKRQSPVSLSSSKSVPVPLPALEMIGYRDYLPGRLHLRNNGHSVAMGLNDDASSQRLPYIFGATLPENEEYQLDHLHFHWGRKNQRGSEHTLNGIRYPMEMHIVHRNKAYSNLSDALDHENGLVVLGIFFQLQEEDNKSLHPILKDLKKVRWLNKATILNIPVTLASLLPRNTDVFYVYKGSLTTPPCSEVVTWIIFPTPVPISFDQLEQFRCLHNEYHKLADNYRQLQNLGKRKVYVRRLDSIRNYNETIFNVTNLDWFWN